MGDSVVVGGDVPGLPGASAWCRSAPDPSPIPVLIAVPHAGRCYPPGLLAAMHNPALAARRLEDRLLDHVAGAVARRTGAALLVAQAPRAMIDLNRSLEDMDWSMLAPDRESAPAPRPPTSLRARSGLGLVPRRLPGSGELWREPIGTADLAARLSGVHDSYHSALASQLKQLRRRWGAALLIDLHSMPPLRPGDHGGAAPGFVLGDRFGASCSAGIASLAQGWLARAGQCTAYNRPYAGGYALDRHAAVDRGVHAIQIEICRSLYLDASLTELADGAQAVAETLTGLVRALAAHVAGLAHGGALAAE